MRHRNTAIALSMLKRKRRAEGGETFPELVARNPKGWGDGPGSPENPSPTTGEFTPSGKPIPDLSNAPFFGTAGPEASLTELAKDVGPEALAFAPVGKPLALAVKYARPLAGVVGAALGFGANMAGAGPEDASPEAEIQRLTKRLEDLTAKRDAVAADYMAASKDSSAELMGKGKSGKGKGPGPISEGLAKQAAGMKDIADRYNADIKKVQDRIDYLNHTMTDEYKQEQDLINANIEARKPWYERTGVPGAETALTWGPPIATALWARHKFNKIVDEGSALLKVVQEAKASGNLADEAAARVALDAWRRAAPKEALTAAAEGVVVPGGFRTIGTIGDAMYGPEVKNKEGEVTPGGAKQQAQDLLHRMYTTKEGFLGEAVPQWGQGAEAILGGAFFARRPPLGKISAETSYLKGVGADRPQSALQKALSYAPHRSMSPDEIAREMAKRRTISSPESAASTTTGPTPSWPGAMRGESTRPASQPPTETGPSGMLDDLTSVRPTIWSPTSGKGSPWRPEVAPMQSAPPSAASDLPPGLAKDKNGIVYDTYTGHKVKKRYFEAKGEGKGKPPKAQKQPKSEQKAAKDEGELTEADFDPNNPSKLTRGMATGGVASNVLRLVKKYAGGPVLSQFAEAPSYDVRPTDWQERVVRPLLDMRAERGADSPWMPVAPNFDLPARVYDPHAINNGLPQYRSGGAVVGAMRGHTGGRTDALPADVPPGSYIIPADVVSGWPGAEGNTNAGLKLLEKAYGPSGKRSGGGKVPILISDGEFIVSPEAVAKEGGGDLSRGHRILDEKAMKVRAHNIHTLSRLPPPARD